VISSKSSSKSKISKKLSSNSVTDLSNYQTSNIMKAKYSFGRKNSSKRIEDTPNFR